MCKLSYIFNIINKSLNYLYSALYSAEKNDRMAGGLSGLPYSWTLSPEEILLGRNSKRASNVNRID